MTEQEINEAMDKAYKKAGHNAYFNNGFLAGIQFATDKHLEGLKSDYHE